MLSKEKLAQVRDFLKATADNFQQTLDNIELFDDGTPVNDEDDYEEVAAQNALIWHAIECVEAHQRVREVVSRWRHDPHDSAAQMAGDIERALDGEVKP